MAEVSIRDVRKSFARSEVVHGISIDIADGEFVVVVGPSGCGKSTLLRMVAGLEAITSGEIAIAGRIVNEVEPKDRDIAMVFQNYALYPHMSVRANMSYGLKLRGMAAAEIERRVEEAGELLQLAELLDRKPRQLSGGQRQRVAMGRAIVRHPAVFLFDEPLSNLDAKLRVQMRLEIRKLQRRLGVTSIYVTHDQVEAMTMADRLVVMNAGVAEQIGAPMEVYDNPASRFVAGFVGSPSMNFLPVRLDGDQIVLASGATLARPDAMSHSGNAVLGIRPEHFRATSDDEAGLDLKIEVVEPLGADTLVHGQIDGADNAGGSGDGAFVTVRFNGPAPIGSETLRLAPDPARLCLFDEQTGRRLQ